jgi:uncharacterized phage infection (PIP) family protein YhgE
MTTDTLMTDAATTTEGNASQDAAGAAAAPATAPAATTAPDASNQQQATNAQNTDAAKAEGGETGGDQAPAGAPEKYEFAIPDGSSLDAEGLEAFSEVAKELNLSQDAAQKVIDKMAPAMAARQAEAIEAVRTEWLEGSKVDKEFGGDKLNENLSVAKKALDTFGTPELRTLLNETGLGNHPEIIRMMYRAGKAISEDRFVAPSSGGPTGSKDYAKSLYPNQQP